MATPEIKVKIGADTKDLDNGIKGVEGRLATFARAGAAAAATAVAALAAGMVALTKRSMAEIDAQAKLAQSLGTTVASMQTLQRAGELAGVSMSGIQQATSDLTRRLSQAASGTGPVADALDRLNLSAAALAQVPLDQRIMQINEALDQFIPATERAAVAGQLFGEEGSLAMSRIDTATLRQATEDVYRFGVVTSELDADNIETANDAVSRLGLVMQGMGNIVAAEVAPAIETLANGIVNFIGNVAGFRIELEQFFGTLEMARISLGEDLFNQLLGNPALIREHTTALEAIVVEMESLAQVAATVTPQLRIFADELEDLGESGAADEMRAIADAAEQANADFAAGAITQEEYNTLIADTAKRAQDVVTEFENINGADFSNAFANITTLANGLRDAAAAAAAARSEIFAAMNMTPAPAGGAMSGLAGGDLLPPSPLAPSESIRPQQQGVDSFGNWQAAQGQGQGGGAGAAITDMFAQRLEALQEGLMTEAEVVAEWYQNSLETLAEAKEREILTEEEYRQLRERLEAEHQERLGKIRDLGNESALSSVIGAGQQILSALGATNQKALRIAKVFGAAQAFVDTYAGAAAALKLPFPQNLAAAAAIIAKGIGFVTAIKGVNEGGGGATASAGGGGGGGIARAASVGGGVAAGGAGASPAQTPTTTFQFTLTNDPFGFGENFARQFIDQLNATQRNGGQIRGVIA